MSRRSSSIPENAAKDIYAENKMLRQRLEDYLAQAHKNESKLRRFQAHELRLSGSTLYSN